MNGQVKTGWDGFKKSQAILGFVIVGLMIALAVYVGGKDPLLPVGLTTGLAFGYILTRSRYGFAGGVKMIYVTGDGSLTKSILALLAIGAFIVAAIQWQAVQDGAVLKYLAQSGDKIVPGSNNIYFTNINTIIGGFIFGIGMIMAGGCASGTLSDLGEGEGRSLIAVIFFILGAVPGHYVKVLIEGTELGKIGGRMHLPTEFGFPMAIILTVLFLFILYAITRLYEDKRKKEGFYFKPEFEDFEKPIPPKQNFSLFSWETYHKFFIERWTFYRGGLLLAIFGAIVIAANAANGRSWGVTSSFTVWGVAFLQSIGMDFSNVEGFGRIVGTINKGLMNHYGTLSNIGVLVGAMVAFLLAGRSNFNFNFRFKDGVYFIIGGFLMGFGARLANGCNIGAMFSSVINFSISGWVFTIALALGAIAGLKMFEGRICIIPPNRHKRK